MAYNQLEEYEGDEEYNDQYDYGNNEVYDYENNGYDEHNSQQIPPPPSYDEEDDVPLPQSRTHQEILETVERPAGYEKNRQYDEENLGEDFEETPWVPPSINKAVDYRAKTIFRGGNASLWNTKLCTAPDIGLGTALYFQFVKDMAICFLLMFFLSLPSLMFSYFGKRIPAWQRDTLDLYKWSIGNIGFDPSSPTYATDSTCQSRVSQLNNQTCIHFGPINAELTMVEVGGIITACEFLQIIVFFCTIYHLQKRVNKLKDEVDRSNTTVTDYAIMVRNLPPDTTVDQLVSHFTNLYPLDKPDWQNRPTVRAARPVERVTNSLFLPQPFHINTWVAECTLMRKIGKQLLAFKDQEDMIKDLRRTRAMMKMYADSTPHAKGPNPIKYARAEQKMIGIGAKIDMLAEKVFDKRKVKKTVEESSSGALGGEDVVGDIVEADAVAACVVFEYCESYARCIEDYAKYDSFPRNLCFPNELKFRGCRISVSRAPEPDSVVWENLEVSKWAKWLKRGRTSLIGLVLLVLCFFVILNVSEVKKTMSKRIPPVKLCETSLPVLFNVTGSMVPSVKLTRPQAIHAIAYDKMCATAIPGSFYATYTDRKGSPVAHYNISACTTKSSASASGGEGGVGVGGGVCPVAGQRRPYCPCITTVKSSALCETIECSQPEPDGSLNPLCSQFHPSLVGDCFCLAELQGLLTTTQAASTVQSIQHGGKGNPNYPAQCERFLQDYSYSSGLTYLATFATVIVNYLLSLAMIFLTKAEAHSSVSKMYASLAIKIFICTFINMALVVLVAFGGIAGLPTNVYRLGIFHGQFSDFTPEWYSTVGSIIIVTFIIQVLSPIVYPLTDFYIASPLSRCRNYPMISAQRSILVVMQDEVNQMEVGPEFDTSSAVAQMLALVFVAMLYAPGLPILTLLAAIAFALSFRIDKMLICRYYKRPPNIDESTIQRVLTILPYAAIFRLMFAIYMFGSNVILPDGVANIGVNTAGAASAAQKQAQKGHVGTGSTGNAGSVSTSQYEAWLQSQEQLGSGPPTYEGIYARVVKANVFPLFVLLVIVVLLRLIVMYWRELPVYWVLKLLANVRRILCCKKEKKIYAEGDDANSVHAFDLHKLNDPLRQEAAPFSGDYYSYVRDKDEIPTGCVKFCRYDDDIALTEGELADGWVIIDGDRFLLRKKQWTRTNTVKGVTRVRGDFKRTYELVDDHGINSYNLEKIPAYRNAILGLKEGAANLAEYKSLEEGGTGGIQQKKKQKETFAEKYEKSKKKAASMSPAKNAWGAPEAQSLDAPRGSKVRAWTAVEDDDDDEDEDGDDDEEGDDA